MDRLSDALTLFGGVLIVGGVTMLVGAVYWLRHGGTAVAEAEPAPGRVPRGPQIRRSALLAETVPLRPVPPPAATFPPVPPRLPAVRRVVDPRRTLGVSTLDSVDG